MKNFTFSALLLFVSLHSLGQDTTPPVAVLSPLSESANIPLDQVLTVVFDELVQSTNDDLTVNIFEPFTNGGFGTVADLSITTGELVLTDDGNVSTLTITPSEPLPANTELRIVITPGHFEDLAGNAWAGTFLDSFNGFVWQFTTELGDTPCVSGNLELEITFDGFAEETSWRIINFDGSITLAEATYTSTQSNTTIIEQITDLPDGTYQFIIEDSFGDGICCSQGFGSYKVTKNNVELFGGASFGASQAFTFCIDASVDSEVPVITCPVDITADAGSGCSTVVSLTDPMATDNVSTNFTFEGVRTDGRSLTDPFFVGDTFINWTATDEAGNVSDHCQQVITISSMGDCWLQVGEEFVGNPGDQLGAGVSINAVGDRIAYVNPNVNGGENVGQVTVLERNGDDWNVLGNPVPGGQFGRGRSGVDLNDVGDRLAVSLADGNVGVYQFNGGSWQLLGAEIPAAGLPFIQKVDFNAAGDRLAVGYTAENMETGLVVVYELQNGSWSILGEVLNGDIQGDDFGRDVSLNANGNRMAVGAYQTSLNQPGYVRVFELNNASWAPLGDDIVGDNPGDFFGVSVNMNDAGNRLVVGASAKGYAKVFEFANGQWSQMGTNLVNNDVDQPGYQVDMNGTGDIVLIGDFDRPAHIFQWSNGQWQLLGQPIYAHGAQDCAINKTGDIVILGKPDTQHDVFGEGLAVVYEYSGNLLTGAETVATLDENLGRLIISDANGGSSDDAFTLGRNGDNFVVTSLNDPITVSGSGILQINANTIEVPLSSIQQGMFFLGEGGTNTMTLDWGLDLTGGGNFLVLNDFETAVTGDGILKFDGFNVNNGTFDIGSATIEVGPGIAGFHGSRLIGVGTITGDLFMYEDAVIAPGTSPGAINTGDLTFEPGSVFEAEINGNVLGIDHDQIVVTGILTLNNAVLEVSGEYEILPGDEIVLIDNDGEDTVMGTFRDLPEGAIVDYGVYSAKISYTGGDGNDVVLVGEPISEPSNLIITEILYDPLGGDGGWEWVELYNRGDEIIDLDGFFFDDNTASSLSDPNILTGTIEPGEIGILFDADDVSEEDFANVWGSNLNLIAVTDWPALNNTNGDSIGLWSSFENYDGDNQNQNNTFVKLAYKVGEGDWPGNLSGRSIFLTNLEADNTVGSNWELSVDGENGAYTGESRNDVGSPGIVPDQDEDTEAPVVVCPETIMIPTDEDTCGAMFDLPVIEVSDNVSTVENIEVSISREDGLELTEPYPIGENTVIVTATDETGNTSEPCPVVIMVTDEQAPEITCSADIVIVGMDPQVLEIMTPTATDNCMDKIPLDFERSDNAELTLEDAFPVGTTTIIWMAMDENNNMAMCAQTVTIGMGPSMENDITNFGIPNQLLGTDIDEGEKTVRLVMPIGSDLTALVPNISISSGAMVSPATGVAQDFTQPVVYTVTAEDGTEQEWTVTVELMGADELLVIGFTLINAETDEPIRDLVDGEVIDINDLPTLHLDIRANTTEDVESVRISMEGAMSTARTESLMPFALYRDLPVGDYIGEDFVLGQYAVSATPYSEDGLGGNMGTPLSLNFELFDSSPTLTVTGFTLINADTEEPIKELVDGEQIDINSLSTTNLDIRANTTDDVESVRISIVGELVNERTESLEPYALFQDLPIGDYMGEEFVLGEYTVVATPYSGNSLTGEMGTLLTLSFELVDGDPICSGFTAEMGVMDPTTCGGGGSITVTPMGGMAPYEVAWITVSFTGETLEGVTAGTYSANVSDANGCSIVVSTEVVDPEPPTVTLAPFVDALETDSVFELTGGMPERGTYSGDGVVDGMFDPSIGPGTYEIIYEYTDLTTECMNSATQEIVVRAESQNKIIAFWLVNADNEMDLFEITDGMEIDITDLPTDNLDIRAEAGDDTESVGFNLSGAQSISRGESLEPYALFQDLPIGDFIGHQFDLGDYILSGTPYSENSLQGAAGEVLTIDFSFMAPAPDLTIFGFTLIDAEADEEILPLVDGMIVRSQDIPSLFLDIRADASEDVESVRLQLTGQQSTARTESLVPYALYRDFPIGDYIGNVFEYGTYMITVTPYSGDNLTGVMGEPFSMTFEIIEDLEMNAMSLSPNQASTFASASFKKPTDIMQVMVFDMSGRLIEAPDPGKIKNGDLYELDVNFYQQGTYIVKMIDDRGVPYQRQLVVKRQ